LTSFWEKKTMTNKTLLAEREVGHGIEAANLGERARKLRQETDTLQAEYDRLQDERAHLAEQMSTA
jgi:hypothetical protein